MVAWLKPKFQTPADADAHYFRREDSTTENPQKKLSDLSRTFTTLCYSAFGLEVPDDFLVFASKAMLHLHQSKRSNVVYKICKGIGELRHDQSDSRFPAKRMPMGLLEYMTAFFASDDMKKVQCRLKVILYFYLYIVHGRSHGALMIIDCGCKLCMLSLVRSGQNCITDRCGLLLREIRSWIL